MEGQEKHISQNLKTSQQGRSDVMASDCSWLQEQGLVDGNITSMDSYVNKLRPIQSLTGINTMPNSLTAAPNVIKSCATPAIAAMQTASLTPKLTVADNYLPGGLAIHSNAMAISFRCSCAMDISNSTGSTNEYLNRMYSPVGLLASHQHLDSWGDPSVHLCNFTAKMYEGGNSLNHIYPKDHLYDTFFTPSLAAINAFTHIKPLSYSGYTADSLLSNALLPTGLGSPITGATAVTKLHGHKFYGGGDWIPYLHYHKLNSVDHHIPKKWYGGGEAVPISSNEIARSIDLDYDYYVVNQKRDTYKYLLDNYDYKSGVKLADWSPIAPGTNWSDAVTGKLSRFVDSLDLYIATKDYSLLHEIHHQEWEVIALSYSVGMGFYLEAFYDRINSRSARNKYARRRLAVIIYQKLKVKYKLDLRIIFRNKIHFLFKNMDDEPEGKYVELKKRNNIFQPFKTLHHGNREDKFYFRYAA